MGPGKKHSGVGRQHWHQRALLASSVEPGFHQLWPRWLLGHHQIQCWGTGLAGPGSVLPFCVSTGLSPWVSCIMPGGSSTPLDTLLPNICAYGRLAIEGQTPGTRKNPTDRFTQHFLPAGTAQVGEGVRWCIGREAGCPRVSKNVLCAHDHGSCGHAGTRTAIQTE